MNKLLSTLLLLGFGFFSSHALQAQVVELTPEQYDEMKLGGTLPDEFHVEWPTLPPPHVQENNSERAGNGACDCWIEPDNTYTLALAPNDDGSSSMITLPFQFNLYGDLYNTCYVNNNGNLSFQTSYGTYSSAAFPNTQFKMVAPFWADVDTRNGGGTVKYKLTSNALYVNWTAVGYFDQQTDKLNTFQLIISDGTNTDVGIGSNVSFCYKEMEWTTGSASGGTNGFGGTPATVGANRGNGVDFIQFGRFDHAGMDYDGPFGANDGVGWLSNKNFVFTTVTSTSNIPPIASSASLCDTLTVCVGELVEIDVDFLSPEPDQLTTASYTIDPPINALITETNTSPANTANLNLQFIPTVSDIGMHEIVYTATDDGEPPLTSTVSTVIVVLDSPSLESGSLVVCDNDDPIDMLSVLGPNAPTGGVWYAPDNSSHSGTFNPPTDMEGDYVYAVSVGSVCEATGTVTMTKTPHADAGQGAALAYCSNDDTVDLFTELGGTPQTDGTWFKPNGTTFNGLLDPGSDQPGSYRYLIYGTNPCPNDTAVLDISIPRSVDAGEDNTLVLCRDASPFSMVGHLGGTPDAGGTWTDMDGTVVDDLYRPGTDLAGVYTYTMSTAPPCTDQSATLTITLDTLPWAGLDNTLVLCANWNPEELFPLLDGAPDEGGHWLDPDGHAIAEGIVDPGAEYSGNYAYVVQGPGQCAHLTDTALVNVVVNPIPVISFSAEPDSGCHPLEVTFTNTTDSMYVGQPCVWSLGDGSAPTEDCSGPTHRYEQPGSYTVKLRITTPEGCTDELVMPQAVIVEPAPQADFVFTPDPGTTNNSTVVFSATDPHAIEYEWDFPEGVTYAKRQVQHTFPDKIADDYTVCLKVTDRYGCEDEHCQVVSILVPSVWVPNAFTPDGDGQNEVFKPILRDMTPDDYHLLIFDRWGRTVFETEDIHKAWDGKKNGSVLPTGVYLWRLHYRPMFSAEALEKYGTVILLK